LASTPSTVTTIAFSTAFVACVVGALFYFDAQHEVVALLEWLNQRGAEAALLFVLIIALVVILLLPGVLFTTGAGFVFGIVKGTILIVVGTTIGALAAFLIARYLFGVRLSGFVLSHVHWQHAAGALHQKGCRIVMLSRMVPFFPFKLSNYFFGLTPVKLRDFVTGTFLGIIPLSLHNVYLGALAADLSTLGSRPDDRSTIEWVIYALGFVLVVAALLGLAHIARNALTGKYNLEQEP